MTHLVAAELLKLRTVRSTWFYAFMTAAFAGLIAAANIGGEPGDRRDAEFQTRLALDSATSAVIIALIVGIVLMTSEFRYGTITRTLLATPRRGRLLVAKLITGGTMGALLMVLAFAVTMAVAAVWLGIVGVPLEPGDAVEGAAMGLAAAALLGVFGVAIGGAVHSQVGALVGTLVWIFVAEPLVWVLFGLLDIDGAAEYLPAASMLGMTDSSDESLTFGASVAVSLGWIALAVGLAALRTGRRDIT